MCAGIAVALRDLPQEVMDRHGLRGRIVRRQQEADEELRFLYRDPQPLLPVWCDNQLLICTWGNQRAFEFFGGVPRRISYDNSRIAVAKFVGKRGDAPTREFLRLQSHYLFSH